MHQTRPKDTHLVFETYPFFLIVDKFRGFGPLIYDVILRGSIRVWEYIQHCIMCMLKPYDWRPVFPHDVTGFDTLSHIPLHLAMPVVNDVRAIGTSFVKGIHAWEIQKIVKFPLSLTNFY